MAYETDCAGQLNGIGAFGLCHPETRIRTTLIDAGLSQPIAACMADRMVDRLSLVQLNKLNGLKKLRGQDMRKVTVEEFLRRTRSLQDPEILGSRLRLG